MSRTRFHGRVPAEHWRHLRTTNPIESTFATVRLRTKGAGSRMACLTMAFKLAQSAERKWRKLNGYKLLGDVRRCARGHRASPSETRESAPDPLTTAACSPLGIGEHRHASARRSQAALTGKSD